MATNRFASKAPNRSRKPATKQKHKSKKLHRASREPMQDTKRSRAIPAESAPSLAERLQAEREQLFKALAIVECCKFASATSLGMSDLEFMVPAFEAVCDLINASAGELGCIADDYRHITQVIGG